MGQLIATPEMLLSTAADVEEIGSTISAAYAAAAGPTTGLLSAAQDEVSAAIAKYFGQYGDEYQAVLRQAAAFHSEFTRALTAAGTAYAEAEAANAVTATNLLGSLGSPLQNLFGTVPTGAGGATGGTVQALLAHADVALITGGTANPFPDPVYVSSVSNSYIQQLIPGAVSISQFTPEQFWPVTPQLGGMSFGKSVALGVSDLNAAVLDQINNQHHSVTVFGYSQSATVANNLINHYVAMGSGAPNPNDLSFVLVGDPNNPNGGILSRFPGFYIPFLNVDFNGATPSNSPYPTAIYTAQYDGIANAPQYPLNVLSDLNAVLGYFFVHNTYPFLTPDQVANAWQLPTSPGYTGNTDYYMIPTQDLPLVEPIRLIPYAGPPMADIIQPDLRVLVDLGYGSHGYADLATPASLISVPNWPVVAADLARGAVQGPYAAAVEIGVEAGLWGPEWFPDTYPWVPSPDPNLHLDLGQFLNQSPVTGLSLASGALGAGLRLIPAFF
jgi:PE-PPE domain/PE family